jgi:hypothetical protein
MLKASKTFFIIFPIFFVIIFLTTYGLLNGYFEQDEWLGIATVMKSYNLPWWNIFVPGQIHFAPIGVFIWTSLYSIFGLHAIYYYLIELIIHASVATLVFILTLRLTNKKAIATLTGLLFLLNGRAHQGFTHLAIFHTTDTALFFILLFFVYLSGVKDKLFSLKNALILFLIFLGAVCTREEGFIIIPLLVIYILTYGKSKINKKNITPLVLFAVGIVFFLFIRSFAQTLYKEPIALKYQITGNGAEYNLLTLPPKYIVQNMIYSEDIAVFLLNNTQKVYPDIDSYFKSQAPLMDAAFFYIFILLLTAFILWLWFIKPKNIGSILLFCLIWIGANSFMLAFVGRHISVLEPRYLYFSAFPVFCLFSVFVYHLFIHKFNFKPLGILSKSVVVMLIAVLLVTSFQQIRTAVTKMSDSGTVKKKLLANLVQVHPKLSKNTIFYIKCKSTCHRNGDTFGIPNENVLPFSSGPGMNILVTYAAAQHEEKDWGQFFTHEFLFQMFDEDYKRIGDRSFGYFVTKSKLVNTLKRNHLSKDNIVVLEYNEDNYTFKDISKDFNKTINLN